MKFKEQDYVVHQDFDKEGLDYNKIQNSLIGYEKYALAKKNCFFIFDYHKHNYLYLKSYNKYFTDYSEEIKEPYLYFNGKLHPDDVDFIHEIHHRVFKYVFSLKIEERKDLLLYYKCRMKNNDNEYVATDITLQLIETDKKGNIWLVLFIIEKSPNDNFIIPYIETINGERNQFVLNQKYFNDLSKTEQEIVSMLFGNLTRKEIADKLCKSLNCIKYHLKNIYNKLEVKDRFEFQRKMLS